MTAMDCDWRSLRTLVAERLRSRDNSHRWYRCGPYAPAAVPALTHLRSGDAFGRARQVLSTGQWVVGGRPVLDLVDHVLAVEVGEGDDTSRLQLAALSQCSDERVAERSGHRIHQDQPDLVVTAIIDVADSISANDCRV